MTSRDEHIQIMIEELYQPLDLARTLDGLERKRWVPHKVIYSGDTTAVKNGKMEVKSVQYQTAYYTDLLLYQKLGFRIVAVYYNQATGKLESIEREYLIGD
jgi:predicted metal-dependent HD superfamily phosphohydrolase